MVHILDWLTAFAIAILMIVGGYQFYFLPQKYKFRRPQSLITPIDRVIPFRPAWVWVYSGLYYPFILSIIVTIDDFRHFSYTAFNFFLLLVVQIFIAFIVPVKTPDSWRQFDPNNSVSERFLSLVHHYDKGGNCFPSMHVAVAMLAALHLFVNIGHENGFLSALVVVGTGLILLSTLFTKQHFFMDIPAGACLAIIVFWAHFHIY